MGEPVGKAISIISMTEEDDDEEELSTATILTSTGLRQATFATPKAPPQTKSPPKSILKKRSMDTGTIGLPQPSPQVSKIEPNSDTSSNKTYPAMVAASDHHDLDSRSPPGPFSQPMMPSWTASAPMPPAGVSGAPIEAFELGIWPPVPKATTTPSPLLPSHLAKSDLSPPDLSPPSTPHRAVSHGAAFPPDFTPGVQSNSYQDCGGERPQGEVLGHLHESFPPQQYIYGGESVENAQQQQQGATFRYQSSQISLDGPFALSEGLVLSEQEDLGHDYGQVESGRPISVGGYGPTNGMGSSGVLSGNGMNRRSINFLDTVEIIPAHRKSDYNRRSDKNATFRILTADMKSEIREELNSYKMREMAVHIESMGNTAFH
ncbi:hypothetical protein BGZ74_004955 [Mortierella antarctica]|nr:hypothetical protein BGZ74_004955 [Mortierella antarctica]